MVELPFPSTTVYGLSFCGLFSELALAFIETQNTFLKMVVIGRSELWGSFSSKGLFRVFVSLNKLPIDLEKEQNKLIIIVLLVTQSFISKIKCVNTVVRLT